MHVLFGPDGNRRYAHRTGISYAESYRLLGEKLEAVAEWSIEDSKINTLSLWLLQEYNLQRPGEEVKGLTNFCETFALRIAASPIVTRHAASVCLVGELNTFFARNSLPRELLEEAIRSTQRNGGMRVNLILAYNADSELRRALESCKEDQVEPSFHNICTRWSIPPVDLFIRTGQPDGFVNLSSYWPLIERGRIISIPLCPQEFTKADYRRILHNCRNLKDSIKKVLADE
jgi:undecaprenyl diphosphate synthase